MLNSVFLFFSFSGGEIMLILFVALMLFGGDKFPEIARGLGKGIREFKDMSDGVKREIHTQINQYDVNNYRDNPAAMPPPDPIHDVPAVPPILDHEHDPNIPPTPPVEHEAYAPATPPAAYIAAADEAGTVERETAVAAHEPVAPPKPDLSQPPNTMPHQSY